MTLMTGSAGLQKCSLCGVFPVCSGQHLSEPVCGCKPIQHLGDVLERLGSFSNLAAAKIGPTVISVLPDQAAETRVFIVVR